MSAPRDWPRPRDLLHDADPKYVVTLGDLQGIGACGVGAKAAFRALGLSYDAEVRLRDLADLIPPRVTGARLRWYVGWAIAAAVPIEAARIATRPGRRFGPTRFPEGYTYPALSGDDWHGIRTPTAGDLRSLAAALRDGTAR